MKKFLLSALLVAASSQVFACGAMSIKSKSLYEHNLLYSSKELAQQLTEYEVIENTRYVHAQEEENKSSHYVVTVVERNVEGQVTHRRAITAYVSKGKLQIVKAPAAESTEEAEANNK